MTMAVANARVTQSRPYHIEWSRQQRRMHACTMCVMQQDFCLVGRHLVGHSDPHDGLLKKTISQYWHKSLVNQNNPQNMRNAQTCTEIRRDGKPRHMIVHTTAINKLLDYLVRVANSPTLTTRLTTKNECVTASNLDEVDISVTDGNSFIPFSRLHLLLQVGALRKKKSTLYKDAALDCSRRIVSSNLWFEDIVYIQSWIEQEASQCDSPRDIAQSRTSHGWKQHEQ